MQSQGIKGQTVKQLTHFLGVLRGKLLGAPNLSYGELQDWCTKAEAVPDNDDQAYVVHHNINRDGQKVSVMLSTRSLLMAAAASDVVHVDATYKLNWQGYPILIAGVTDAASQFFPCIFAVMTSEKEEDYTSLLQVMTGKVEKATQQVFAPRVVMGNCAEAISKAVQTVFPGAVRRVCWFHVKKAIDTKLRGEKKEWRAMVLGDMGRVQLSVTPEQFDRAFDLMCEHWLSSAWPSAGEFVEYVRSQYHAKNPGWYEGFDLRSPSTNNALESFNGQIVASHHPVASSRGQVLADCH